MMAFLRAHQLNFMLSLSGICTTLAILVLISKALSAKRRIALISMELVSAMLIFFDRLAYIYAGDPSKNGYIMVRVSNFIVFFMTAGIIFVLNMYLSDLLLDEGGMKSIPRRLKAVYVMCIAEMIMVVISQFTGLYYYFDEYNLYHRGDGFLLCYIMPVVATLIQFSVVMQYKKKISKPIYISLILFIFVPMISGIIQIWAYGLSLVNIAMVFVAVAMYIFAYYDINEKAEKANKKEIEYLHESQERMKRLFDQTAKAFVNAIDSRAIFSSGHSERVAEYSRKLAERGGLDEEECEDVYYAALMHDVGKLATPDEIIKKGDEVSDEEYEIIKKQPVVANQILSDITDLPELGVGAHYHHERYDGKGYPDGIKGENIPEVARIIAVADAYDSMTSKSDSRDALPQQVVREYLIEGSGTRFDPKYATIMLEMIDLDTGYSMKETGEGVDAIIQNEFDCDEYRSVVTYGMPISQNIETIRFKSKPLINNEGEFSSPSLILFDSLDRRVHDTSRAIEATRYLEYGEIWFDGNIICTIARNMRMEPYDSDISSLAEDEYVVETVRYSDHVRLRLMSQNGAYEAIAALPDSSRFAYLAITGEHCHISDIEITKSEDTVSEEEMPRIAEEISYINRLVSDLPNVQVDGFCRQATPGVPIKSGMRVDFHAMSLPAANLVWHCPYVIIFHSKDGLMHGEDYREYALVRLDGEKREQYEGSENKLNTETAEDFAGWDNWKKQYKRGLECEVVFERIKNRIITSTTNLGISIDNVTTIKDGTTDIYMALTGDQVAITDIRIFYR